MIRSAFLFSIIFVLVSCGNKFDKLLTDGAQNLKDGNYELADSIFTAIITERQDNHAAYNNRAVTRLRMKRYKEALSDIEKAISLKNEIDIYWITSGEIKLAMNQVDEAKQDIMKALSIRPDNADAHFFKGSIELLNWEVRASLKSLKWAVELDGNHLAARTQLVVAYIHDGQYEKAVYKADQLINSGQLTTENYNNRGYAKLKMEQYPLALDDFNVSLDLNGDNVPAMNNRALALYKTGDTTRAMQELQLVLNIDPGNISALKNRALIQFESGNKNKACADWMRASFNARDSRTKDEISRLLEENCLSVNLN